MLNIWFHEVQLCKVHIIQLVLREFSEPSITQRVENIILPFLDFSKSVFTNNNNNDKKTTTTTIKRCFPVLMLTGFIQSSMTVRHKVAPLLLFYHKKGKNKKNFCLHLVSPNFRYSYLTLQGYVMLCRSNPLSVL